MSREPKLPPRASTVKRIEAKEVGERITEYQERADHLMRMSSKMQQEAMLLYAEIAVLSRYRNAAWDLLMRDGEAVG